MSALQRQRGVALIAAILLVAVGTILAAAIAFQSAMATRRGVASLSFEQSLLVAEGAEALAAYALREDGGQNDHPAESWAKPFGPTEIAPGVVLEATLEDLTGRFNLNSLILGNGNIDPEMLATLQRVLEMLELEPHWAQQIADWIDGDVQPNGSDGLEDSGTTGQDPPYRTANTLITSASELLALPGFGRERYLKLAPYVTALPPGTKLNVCTASGPLLDALVESGYRQYSLDPDGLVKNREKECWPVLADYQRLVSDQRQPHDAAAVTRLLDENSGYFRLTSLVTIGGTEFTLYSLLKHESPTPGGRGGQVRVLQRSFTPD